MSNEVGQETNLEAVVPEMLAPLSGKLEFNPQRLQQEIMVLNRLEGVLVSIIHFERGRRYNLMWETLQGPECPTFKAFLSQWFPEADRREVYRDMKFAVMAADLPNFRGLADCRGGWGKMEMLQDELSPEEVKELDETGNVRGLALRQIAESKSADVRKALKEALKDKEDLSQENLKLKEENDTLKAALNNNDVEAAQKLLSKAGGKIIEAANLLRRIPREHLAADGLLRQSAYAVLAHATGIAEDVEMEIAALAGDPGEQVRNYMGRLRAQHGGVDGAPAADVANS